MVHECRECQQSLAKFRTSQSTLLICRKKRHTADYDPYAMRNPITSFVKSDVIQDIRVTEDVINRFNRCPARDRRAFAVYVLLDIRND